MKEKDKTDKDMFSKKVNSNTMIGEINNFDGEFKINFPIMRRDRNEFKILNKKIKEHSESIIDNDFSDINIIITSLNYKCSISFKDNIIIESFKFCFFNNHKSIIFNILKNGNIIYYIYMNKRISVKSLKHIILLNLFKIDSLKTLDKDILINKMINNEDIKLIKMILI